MVQVPKGALAAAALPNRPVAGAAVAPKCGVTTAVVGVLAAVPNGEALGAAPAVTAQ